MMVGAVSDVVEKERYREAARQGCEGVLCRGFP